MYGKRYKKLKKKYRLLHILLVAVAIVMLWRGVWGILDIYLFPGNHLASSLASVIIALVILYFDDFHLKELE